MTDAPLSCCTRSEARPVLADLGATNTIEATRLKHAVGAVRGVESTLEQIANLHGANATFMANANANRAVWEWCAKLHWVCGSRPNAAPSWATPVYVMIGGLAMYATTGAILIYSYAAGWDHRLICFGPISVAIVGTYLLSCNLEMFKPPSYLQEQAAAASWSDRGDDDEEEEEKDDRLSAAELSCGNLLRLCGSLQLGAGDLRRVSASTASKRRWAGSAAMLMGERWRSHAGHAHCGVLQGAGAARLGLCALRRADRCLRPRQRPIAEPGSHAAEQQPHAVGGARAGRGGVDLRDL